MYKKIGCDACGGSGYKAGRPARTAGRHRSAEKADPGACARAEMLACALEEGMRTLKMDGMEKVLMGLTDMPTVRSVCIK